MRLIFITRKVDRRDPLAGFIFIWLEKLAERLEKLYVICQEKGDVSGLPENIEVHSFGKEKGYRKLRQGYQLLIMSYKYGRKTNGFFVHMHPIYAIVAWLPAKLLGKKIILWYTHKAVDQKLRVAHALVDEVFTASKESFRLPSGKVRIVGHGIDVDKFKAQSSKVKSEIEDSKFRIVSIGRISPVKDLETLIKGVDILVHQQGVKDLEVNIYGKIGLAEHQSYLDSLVEFVHNADLEDVVKFQGELAYDYVDEVLREADLFVSTSQTGSIDKAVLEAAASGVIVLTSNEAFQKPFEKISPLLVFRSNNQIELVEKIQALKALPKAEQASLQKQLRDWVEKEHNLGALVKQIIISFKK